MKARIDALMADLNRMAAELEARNEATRVRIARTDELLAQWAREQAKSDMGTKFES